MQVFGGAVTSVAENKADQANASTLKMGAFIDRINAEAVERATAQEEARVRRAGEGVMSAQEALVGVSGLTSESFEPVLSEAEKNLEMDALAVRLRGENQALSLRRSARFKELNVKGIEAASKFRSITNLLGTGSGVARTILGNPEAAESFQKGVSS
jgi:hypothetical protein